MEALFIDLFGSYGRIIVFFHLASVSILIGSMFMIRFIVKPVLMELDEEKIRYRKCLKMLERYMRFTMATMIVIISASFMMSVGLGFEYASPTLYSLINVKEALWVFIAFNFILN